MSSMQCKIKAKNMEKLQKYLINQIERFCFGFHFNQDFLVVFLVSAFYNIWVLCINEFNFDAFLEYLCIFVLFMIARICFIP